MAKIQITAEQISVGDVFSDGDTVQDFEFFDYPGRRTVEIYVIDKYGDDYSKEYEREALIFVESDILDRESDSENWEDALDQTYFDIDEKSADNIVESVGDLLDY